MGKPVLVIRYDNRSLPIRDCGLCGRRVERRAAPKLCLEDSSAPVCWECGQEYAPEMVGMAARFSQSVGIGLGEYFEDLDLGYDPSYRPA